MIPNAGYVHTNLIARDWRALVRCYFVAALLVAFPQLRQH